MSEEPDDPDSGEQTYTEAMLPSELYERAAALASALGTDADTLVARAVGRLLGEIEAMLPPVEGELPQDDDEG